MACRAQDFVTSAIPWSSVPEIAEVTDAVAAWRAASTSQRASFYWYVPVFATAGGMTVYVLVFLALVAV